MHKPGVSSFVCAGLFGLALLLPHSAAATWPTDPLVNVPLCAASDNQSNPTSAPDGEGGAIVTWRDSRSGLDSDIYAQRISANGTVQWTADGVALCTATSNQELPTIASDGSGGAIVTWYDYRSGNFSDIYAQRISASGAVLWTANGVAICAAAGHQYNPTIISDDAGGAIVTWWDSRSGNYDIYVQRISSGGTVQWTADGEAVCAAADDQRASTIASDGVGGVIVAWRDRRSGNYDIYVQRISSGGTVQWTANGVAICTDTGAQYSPIIVSDGVGGAIFTWYDYRSDNYDIYAQRISASGVVQWTANGVALCTATSNQWFPTIASDGASGAIITWYSGPSGNYDIYVQRISANGTVQWTADGVALCTDPGDQAYPTIVTDGEGGAIVTWYDDRYVSTDIYVQRISSGGTVQWTLNGVALCIATGGQWYPSIASDGSGGAIVTWYDYRNGATSDIYAQWIGGDGAFIGPEPTILSVLDIPADQGGKVRIKWAASYLDSPTLGLSMYGIWRQVEESTALKAVAVGAKLVASAGGSAETQSRTFRTTMNGTSIFYWEGVGTVAARSYPTYTFTTFAFQDSTATSNPYSVFMVDYQATRWPEYWRSNPDSGYSVDNLAPQQPRDVCGYFQHQPAGLVLAWRVNTEADFSHYSVYRSAQAGFVPSSDNLLTTTSSPQFNDPDCTPTAEYFYKLSAVDRHGNSSSYADYASAGAVANYVSHLSAVAEPGRCIIRWQVMGQPQPGDFRVWRSVGTSEFEPLVGGELVLENGEWALADQGVESGQSYAYRVFFTIGLTETLLFETSRLHVPEMLLHLYPAAPNPFNPRTTIRFDLPGVGQVRLAIYDLAGRLVKVLVEGERAAGSYEAVWDGRDTSGHSAPSGSYLARLVAGGKVEGVRLSLVR
jgi:hypothetical protein